MEKKFKVNTLEELDSVAEYICELSKTNRFFCFYGEMGAGKTTLIEKICRAIGITEHISSPTYSIVNEYQDKNNQSVYHMDLYRIQDEMELLDIGISEIMEGDSLCFVEWPDRTTNFIPENFVKVEIELVNSIRTFKITN